MSDPFPPQANVAANPERPCSGTVQVKTATNGTHIRLSVSVTRKGLVTNIFNFASRIIVVKVGCFEFGPVRLALESMGSAIPEPERRAEAVRPHNAF